MTRAARSASADSSLPTGANPLPALTRGIPVNLVDMTGRGFLFGMSVSPITDQSGEFKEEGHFQTMQVKRRGR